MCKETCPIIEGKIGNATAQFLIDTGAKVSLVKEGVLDSINPEWRAMYRREAKCVRLVGITGAPLENCGCFNIPLTLGSATFEHPCYVCNNEMSFPTAGIIGQDLLRAKEIDLIMSRGVTFVGGEEVPIVNWETIPDPSGRVKSEFCGQEGVPVLLVEDYQLPPLTENLCFGTVPSSIPPGRLGIIEAANLKTNGLTVAATLVHIDEHRQVPVRIANLTNQILTVSKNKIVGWLAEAEVAEPLNDGIAEVRTMDATDIERLFDLGHVGPEERGRIVALISRYPDAFALTNLDLGHCGVIKHRIPTQKAAPVYRRAYRIPYSKREEMQRQVDELLEKGIIEHSTSPWGAPALLVEKPDGSFRFVVDYRDLNKVTRVDPYPLPNIQETLSLLGGAQCFSVVDMASGYWQIELDDHDKEKTAFNTPSGHYQWTRMPMGLANSAAVWQRTADVVLAGLLGKLCHVYLDDIIIFSDSFEDHLRHIENVLVRLKEAGLKLKPSKCQFLKPEVKYLGHIISPNGVRPDPEKVWCVREFPRPRNVKEIRQFLGLVGYYRRHIANFAALARPLTRLTSKSTRFGWNAAAEEAFLTLKQRLVQAPVLRFPDFSKPFILSTDASKHAVGAILSQLFDGEEHPVAYASRQLSGAEQKYGATEQECLAVVWGIRHFRCYLYGRRFSVVTDCRSLKWLMNTRDPSSRLARWNLLLQEYDMEIVHKAGKMNQNADALSRGAIRQVEFIPIPDEEDIQKAQMGDKDLRGVISECESAADRKKGNFYLDNRGLLVWQEPRSRAETAAPGALGRVVVPRTLVGKIIKSFHDAPYAGHLGVNKTKLRIAASYFWKGMRRDIRRYCAACEACCLRKSPKNMAPAPLQVFQEVTEPFERTAMDIMGPLPVSTAGNRYILMFIDHLTRYAEAIALPDQKADTVARAFVERIILRHGVPQQLLTDRGSNFTSQLMREVYQLLGIKKLQTTPYHPQCNGAVERLNHTVATMLSHYVARDQRDWDTWLPYATFAYNSAVHEGTKEAPFFLLHGRHPTVPGTASLPPTTHYGTLDNYKAELEQRLRIAHDIARKALSSSAEARRQRRYPPDRIAKYQVGDLVYVKVSAKLPGLVRKLAPHWKGPFEVVEVLSEVTVRLKGVKHRDDKIVHVEKLKPASITKIATPGSRNHRNSETLALGTDNPVDETTQERTVPQMADLPMVSALAWEAAHAANCMTDASALDYRGEPHGHETTVTDTPEGPPLSRYALRSRGPVYPTAALYPGPSART